MNTNMQEVQDDQRADKRVEAKFECCKMQDRISSLDGAAKVSKKNLIFLIRMMPNKKLHQDQMEQLMQNVIIPQ